MNKPYKPYTPEQKQHWFKATHQSNVALNKDSGHKTILTVNKDTNEHIYSSVLDMWQKNAKYQQVTRGRTHCMREMFIADFDDTLENFYKVFGNFPKPSYILKNEESGHVQAGWLFDRPLQWEYNSESFSSDHNINWQITNIINSYSDPQYKGWWVKNPYFAGLTLIEDNFKIYDREELVCSMLAIGINSECNISESNNQIINNNNYDKESSTANKSHSNTGRNNQLLKEVREYVWQQRRKSPNTIPEFETVYSWALTRYNFICANHNRINDNDDTAEQIRKTTLSAYKWANAKFVSTGAKSITREQAELGQIVKYAKMMKDWLVVNNQHGSIRQIVKITGISHGKVQRLLKLEINKNKLLRAIEVLKQLSTERYSDLLKSLIEIKNQIIINNNNYDKESSTATTDEQLWAAATLLATAFVVKERQKKGREWRAAQKAYKNSN